MNNWITHSINFGVFALISFGLMQISGASKGDDSRKEASHKATVTELEASHRNNGPVLAVSKRSRTTSRPVEQTEEGTVYSDFVMDPFEVKISNERHGWTNLDARNPRLVNQLAHNDSERQRLLDENLWTPRRELVYRKETLADLAQKAKESGETPTEVVLPGFAGNEYQVTVLEFESNINEEGVAEGSIKGHLTEDPDSQVIIGYYGQRESGVISSPHLEQDISYDPREDGQVMVKSVDLQALSFAFADNQCPSIYGAHEVGEPNGEL